MVFVCLPLLLFTLVWGNESIAWKDGEAGIPSYRGFSDNQRKQQYSPNRAKILGFQHHHYPHGHTPHVHRPTNKPSSAPTATYTPSISPHTRTPSLSPATRCPSATPTTQAPSTPSFSPSPSPTTAAPSLSPTTISPSTTAPTTAAPSTADPTSVSPVSQSPSMSPLSQSPSVTPATAVPTSTYAPISGSPTSVPIISVSPTSTSPSTLMSSSPTSITEYLAVEINEDNNQFRYAGVAWGKNQPYQSGTNFIYAPYYLVDLEGVRIEMNGFSQSFHFFSASESTMTLRDIVRNGRTAIATCASTSTKPKSAFQSVTTIGNNYNSVNPPNPFNVSKSGFEDRYCFPSLSVNGGRGNDLNFRLGFFRDERGCCCCPGTSEGIGMRQVASGVDEFRSSPASDRFYKAKVFVYTSKPLTSSPTTTSPVSTAPSSSAPSTSPQSCCPTTRTPTTSPSSSSPSSTPTTYHPLTAVPSFTPSSCAPTTLSPTYAPLPSIFKNKSSVVTWGDRIKGGRVLHQDTWRRLIKGEGVKKVFPGPMGFAVVMHDDDVLMWGDPSQSGVWRLPVSVLDKLKREQVRDIVGNDAGFAAITEANEAVAWGKSTGNITLGASVLSASCCAFAAMTSNETTPIVTWGEADTGGKYRLPPPPPLTSSLTNLTFTCGGGTPVSIPQVRVSKQGNLAIVTTQNQLLNINSGSSSSSGGRSNYTRQADIPSNCLVLKCRPFSDFEAIQRSCDDLGGCSGFSLHSPNPSSRSYMNIAMYGTAKQSSTSSVYTRARRAIDLSLGRAVITDGSGYSCAQTKVEDNPWWRLDLGAIFDITTVKIYSRGSTQELTGFSLYVGSHLCVSNASIGVDQMREFDCTSGPQPVRANMINITRPGRSERLSICEVEVIALAKDACLLSCPSALNDDAGLSYQRPPSMSYYRKIEGEERQAEGGTCPVTISGSVDDQTIHEQSSVIARDSNSSEKSASSSSPQRQTLLVKDAKGGETWGCAPSSSSSAGKAAFHIRCRGKGPVAFLRISDPPASPPKRRALIMRDTVDAADLWPQFQFRRNARAPMSSKFAVLDDLGHYVGEDSQYEFIMHWPGTNLYQQHWKQDVNPYLHFGEVPKTVKQISTFYIGEPGDKYKFGGLMSHSSPDSLLDGNTLFGTWWFSVGAYVLYQSKFPGPLTRKVDVVEVEVGYQSFSVPPSLISPERSTPDREGGRADLPLQVGEICSEFTTYLEVSPTSSPRRELANGLVYHLEEYDGTSANSTNGVIAEPKMKICPPIDFIESLQANHRGQYACAVSSGCGCVDYPISKCLDASMPCSVVKVETSGFSTRHDQTVAFWVKAPANRRSQQSVFDFGYDMEGAGTLELSGRISYYYGTGRGHGYFQAWNEPAISSADWTHFAIVRDLQAKTIAYYLNGRLTAVTDKVSRNTGEPRAINSSAGPCIRPKYIGGGYAGKFEGLLFDFRVYNRPLLPWEVERLVAGGSPIALVGSFGEAKTNWLKLSNPGIFLRPDRKLRVLYYDVSSSSNYSCDSERSLPLAQWTKIQIVRAQSVLTLSQNGTEVCRVNLPSSSTTTSSSVVTKKQGGFYYAGGGAIRLRNWRYGCLTEEKPRFRLNQTDTTKISLSHPYEETASTRPGFVVSPHTKVAGLNSSNREAFTFSVDVRFDHGSFVTGDFPMILQSSDASMRLYGMGRGYHPRNQGKVAFEYTSLGGIAPTTILLGASPLSFAEANDVLGRATEAGTQRRKATTVIASAAFEVSVDLKLVQGAASSIDPSCKVTFGRTERQISTAFDSVSKMVAIEPRQTGYRITVNDQVFPECDTHMMGCFEDFSQRTLPHHQYVPSLDREKCIDACKAGGYKYAGLQIGSQCFCGNVLPSNKKPLTECSMPCQGNAEQECGGTWRNRVYETQGENWNRLKIRLSSDSLVSVWMNQKLVCDRIPLQSQLDATKGPTLGASFEAFNPSKQHTGHVGSFFGPYSYSDEDANRLQGVLLSDGQLIQIRSECPNWQDIQWETDLTFTIQRDNSAHSSEVRYFRTDSSQIETFRFDPGSADHTTLRFNGTHLCCDPGSATSYQCNSLAANTPVRVILLSFDFNPRMGTADNNNWQRSRYSIDGSYYRLSRKWRLNYIGCFEDNSYRTLPAKQELSSVSVENCVKRCRTLGYLYAGLQNSNECFCGNKRPSKKTPAGDCNMKCRDNEEQICGGGFRNSVYRTAQFRRQNPGDMPVNVSKTCTNGQIKNLKYIRINPGERCPARIESAQALSPGRWHKIQVKKTPFCLSLQIDDDDSNVATRCVETIYSSNTSSLGNTSYINIPSAGECEVRRHESIILHPLPPPSFQGHTPSPEVFPLTNTVRYASSSSFAQTPTIEPMDSTIPGRRMRYKGREYVFVTEEKSYFDAELDCKRRFRMHLLSIHSAEEFNVIINALFGINQDKLVHFGLNDIISEGTFAYTDGTPTDYTAWAWGEPNNWGGAEDCSVIDAQSAVWNDYGCHWKRYVCASIPPSADRSRLLGRRVQFEYYKDSVRLEKTCYGTILSVKSDFIRGLIDSPATAACQKFFYVYYNEPTRIYTVSPRGSASSIQWEAIVLQNLTRPLEGVFASNDLETVVISLLEREGGPESLPPPPPLAYSGNCPSRLYSDATSGYNHREATINERRFMAVEKELSTSQADTYCQMYAMRLASIHSQAEFDALNVLFPQNDTLSGMWMGGHWNGSLYSNFDGSPWDFGDFDGDDGGAAPAHRKCCTVKRLHKGLQFVMKNNVDCSNRHWFFCADVPTSTRKPGRLEGVTVDFFREYTNVASRNYDSLAFGSGSASGCSELGAGINQNLVGPYCYTAINNGDSSDGWRPNPMSTNPFVGVSFNKSRSIKGMGISSATNGWLGAFYVVLYTNASTVDHTTTGWTSIGSFSRCTTRRLFFKFPKAIECTGIRIHVLSHISEISEILLFSPSGISSTTAAASGVTSPFLQEPSTAAFQWSDGAPVKENALSNVMFWGGRRYVFMPINKPTARKEACARPLGWCSVSGSVYKEDSDCDGDGVPDPVCTNSAGSTSAVLSSEGCQERPSFQCPILSQNNYNQQGYWEAECGSRWGMKLVSIHSRQELLNIKDRLLRATNDEEVMHVWVGLIGNMTEGGSFRWTDGSPVNFLPIEDPEQLRLYNNGATGVSNEGGFCFTLNNLGTLTPMSCSAKAKTVGYYLCADASPATSRALMLSGSVRNFRISHDKAMKKSYALSARPSSGEVTFLNGDFEQPKAVAASPSAPAYWSGNGAFVALQRGVGTGDLDSGSGQQVLSLNGTGAFVRQNLTGLKPNKTYAIHFLSATAHSTLGLLTCTLSVRVNGTLLSTITGSTGFSAHSVKFAAVGPSASLAFEAKGKCLIDGVVVRREDEGGKALAATRRAFAAILPNGTVIAWGDKNAGGEIPPLKDALMRSSGRAAALFASTSRGNDGDSGMFSAWLSDGSVVSWGAQDAGEEGRVRFSCHDNIEELSPSALTCIRGACPIPDWQDLDMNFAECRRRCINSTVLCGGFFFDGHSRECVLVPHSSEKVPVSAITAPSTSLFSGTVPAYLPANHTYCTLLAARHVDRDSIVANDMSFAGKRLDGTIAAWGYRDYGGGLPKILSSTRVHTIVAGAVSFAAITNGFSKLVAWGYGTASSIPDHIETRLNDEKIASLATSGWAYAVLTNRTRAVLAWGDPGAGGDVAANGKNLTSSLSQEVVEITGTNYAFAARKSDGSVVAWGNVHCGGYTDPIRSELEKGIFHVFGGAVNGGSRGCGAFLASRWKYTATPTTTSPSTTSPATNSPTTFAPSFSPSTCSPSTNAPTFTPPMVIEARLSDTLQYIILTFHRPTNTPTEDCAVLLSSATLGKLGSRPTCIWATPSVLWVYFSRGFTIRLGDMVVFREGAVTLDRGGMANFQSQQPLLRPRTLSPEPVPTLIAPQTVGACDEIDIDASTSTGAFGLPLTFDWRYFGPASSSLRAFVQMQERSRFSLLGSNLTVGTHTFSVRYTNWLNDSYSAETVVVRTPMNVPIVTTFFPDYVQIKTSRDNVLRTEIDDPSCSVSKSSAVNRVSWSFLGPNSTYLHPSVDQYRKHITPLTTETTPSLPNPNSVFLSIPRHTLTMGSIYALQLCVETFVADVKQIGINYTFIMKAVDERIVAKIGDGSLARTVYVPNLIGSDDDFDEGLRLDASESHDPGSQYPISQYHWIIQRTDDFSNVLPSTGNISIISNESIAYVNRSTLVYGRYRVTLTVSCLPASGRSSSASNNNAVANYGSGNSTNFRTSKAIQYIRIVSVMVPKVAIIRSTVPKLLADVEKVTPGMKLSFSANVSLSPDSLYTYAWSSNAMLNDQTLLTKDTNGTLLVLRPHTLTSGKSYQFRLVVRDVTSGTYAESVANVVVNAPPTLGTCSVSPSRGVSMHTKFRFGCSEWADEDVPLLFEFRDASRYPSFPLNRFQQKSYFSTLLFAPNEDSRRFIVVALVQDALGAAVTYNDSALHPLVDGKDGSVENIHSNVTAFQSEMEAARAMGNMIRVGLYFRATLASVDESSTTDTSVRDNLFSFAADIADDPSLPVADGSNFALELLSEITDFPPEKPEVLSSNLRENILGLLDRMVVEMGRKGDGGSSALALVAVTASRVADSVGDIRNFSAPISAARLPSNVSDTERIAVAEKVEQMLVNATHVLSKTVGVGELAAKLYTPKAVLMAQKFAAENAAGATIVESLDDEAGDEGQLQSISQEQKLSISLPESFSLDDNSAILGASVVWLKSRPYPSTGSLSSSPGEETLRLHSQLTIELQQNGQDLVVNNTQDPIALKIPLGSAEGFDYRSSFSPVAGGGVTCEYWSVSARRWQTDGVFLANMTNETRPSEGRAECHSRHLTTFRISINTFSGDTVRNQEAYSLSNPLTLFLVCLIGIFTVGILCAFYYDRWLYLKGSAKASRDYWRKYNWMTEVRLVNDRSWKSYKTSLQWAFKKKHTWTAVLLRHNGDYLTSTKRTIILLVLLVNSMTVLALLLEQEAKLLFLSSRSSLAIVSMMMSFPVPMLMIYILHRPVPQTFMVTHDIASASAGWLSWAFFGLLLLLGDLQVNMEMGGDGEIDGGEDEEIEIEDDEGDAEAERNEEQDDDDDDDDNANEEVEDQANRLRLMTLHGSQLSLNPEGAVIGAGIIATQGDSIINKKNQREKRMDKKNTHQASLQSSFRGIGMIKQQSLPGMVTHSSSSLGSPKKSEEKSIQLEKERRMANRRHSLKRMRQFEQYRSANMSSLAMDRNITTVRTLRDIGDSNSNVSGDREGEKDGLICWRKNLCKDADPSLENTHIWIRNDCVAVLIACLAVLGCSFILVNLSFELKEKNKDWVADTLWMFFVDIVFRSFSIVFLEFLLLGPLCGAAYFFTNDEKNVKNRKRIYERWNTIVKSKYSQENGAQRVVLAFASGDTIGFKFHKCRVVDVETGSQSQKHGVHIGWRILRISDQPVLNDSELRKMLFRAHRFHSTFDVEFVHFPTTKLRVREEKSNNSNSNSNSNVSASLNPSSVVEDSEMTWLSDGELKALQQSGSKWQSFVKDEGKWAESRANLMKEARGRALRDFLHLTNSEVDDFGDSDSASELSSEPGEISVSC